MQSFFQNFHARNACNDGGVSDAVNCCKRSYSQALERHLGHKWTKLFRIMDEDDDASYCDTHLHSELCDLLSRYDKDPNHGLYLWWTISTPLENPTKDEVLKLHDDLIAFHVEDGYLDGTFYARLELHTGTSQHLHVHVLSKVNSLKQPSDLKKHMLTPKVAKFFSVRKENIHLGDARHKLLFKRSDKLDYLNGEKKGDKPDQVALDKAFFAALGIPSQYFGATEEVEGADGLVAPDYEEDDPGSPPIDWQHASTLPYEEDECYSEHYPNRLSLQIDSTETAIYRHAIPASPRRVHEGVPPSSSQD